MRRILIYLCLLFSLSLRAQEACPLHISLLTCAPGDELYATFGHTALRVRDEGAGTDLVFNYGTFAFTPDFNIKFIRGKLLYSLSVEDFRDFIYTYQVESRSVQEQELQLTCTEKTRIWLALQWNAQPQNRDYRYDFLFDNCTTRAGDMVTRGMQSPLAFANILPAKPPTFRDLIHSYLDAGHEHWSKLGIDILLGAPLDRKVSNREAMFLPDYLLRGFDKATVAGHPLAAPPQTILAMPSPLAENAPLTPALVFGILTALVIGLSFVRRRGAVKGLQVFDFLFFLVLGLAGLLLLFMWFGTDHQVCRYNYNLLWALPTHVVMAFYVHRRSGRAPRYFRFVAFLNGTLLLAWAFLPQALNPALIPLVLLAAFRAWRIAKPTDHARQ